MPVHNENSPVPAPWWPPFLCTRKHSCVCFHLDTKGEHENTTYSFTKGMCQECYCVLFTFCHQNAALSSMQMSNSEKQTLFGTGVKLTSPSTSYLRKFNYSIKMHKPCCPRGNQTVKILQSPVLTEFFREKNGTSDFLNKWYYLVDFFFFCKLNISSVLKVASCSIKY